MMVCTIVNRNWVNNRRLNITAKNLICFFKEKFSKTAGRKQQANQGSGNRNSNNSRPNNYDEKIIYNTVIKDFKMLFRNETVQPLPPEKPPVVSLKYFSNYFNEKPATLSLSEDTSLKSTKDENKSINLPYKRHDNVTLQNVSEESSENYNKNDVNQQTADLVFSSLKDKSGKKISRKWMQNYDKYSEISVNLHDDESEDEAIDVNKDVKYGTADPKVPSSSVPCGGCGAHLHCQDFAIPGFLPKEIFVGLSDEQLQALVCQRCHFLQEYDTALSVSVDPQMYPKLLSKIKGQTALVILVVDMTDFPCSIWPGILDLVGPKRPLVVVGNKMDLLQDWSRKCLIRAKESLIKHLPSGANILHVELISAKTGFGIESLVTKLYNLWEYRGDVYLVGCTNVGKSTLFNALLQSDYCKTKAVDLMQRATISPWPGTTLNLLKFPIMRPEGWRLASRTLRLREQRSKDLEQLRQGRAEPTPQMISCIERTFAHGITNKSNDDYWDDPFAMPKMSTLRSLRPSGSGLDPNDAVFAQSKWLYDTPGVITPDQIIDLLTTEELMLTLPREPIVPRTFQVWPGQTLFLAGLGRVDYIDGPNNIKMTVLSAPTLPVTLSWLADASDVYEQYLGSDAFAVPCGGESRLQMWPGLEPAPEVTLKGIGWRESCADVVLSSAGWVAVTSKEDSLIRLQAWTPNARGLHIRIPPVLPRAVAVKGIKMHRTQAYSLFNENIKAMLR